MKKQKLSLSLTALLLLLPVVFLAGFGIWWESKQIRVEDARFKLLARPQSLPASVLDKSSTHKLATLEITLFLGYQSIKPAWWGKAVRPGFHRISYTSETNRTWNVYYRSERIRFDAEKQQYVLVCECIIPDDGSRIERGKVTADFSMWNRGYQLADLQLASPIRT